MSTAMFDTIEELAQFCAELVRQGILFDVSPASTKGFYEVRFTGGF